MGEASGRLRATKERPLPEAAPLGLALFLGSLGVLFVGLVVAVVLVRFRVEDWRPEQAGGLPWPVWASTALLVVVSLALHRAVGAARAGGTAGVRGGLLVAAAAAGLFLGSQALAWADLQARWGGGDVGALRVFTFHALTGTHAAHVVGGLVPLAVAARRAFRGRYGPDDHGGLRLLATYWHFLDAVWLALLGVLWALG